MNDWIDGHVHVLGGCPADGSRADERSADAGLTGGLAAARQLAGIERAYGYTGANFLSVEGMDDAAQNALGLYFKTLSPTHYAFGGFHYRFAYDFVQEMETLWALGFDGVKMIENKPTERRRLGYAQDDPRYETMYRRAEELGIPFLIHVNDPRDFWDPERCPDWARAAGFCYGDGSYVSYEQILAEAVSLLKKHPRLQVCYAHLLFLSDNEPRLRRLMDAHPNLWLDVTAGTEMYYAFGREPERWRRFFLNYADRILYGTDNCSRPKEPAAYAEETRIADELNRAEQAAFRAGRYTLWGEELQGLDLPEDVLAKLFAGNFRRFAGAAPRPLDREKAAAYLRGRLNDPRFTLSDKEKYDLRNVYAFFVKPTCN